MTSADLPLLAYELLPVGRVFPARPFHVTPELIASYIDVTGDDDAAYRGPSALVPPGLAGVWARLAYAEGFRLPPGGFMTAQAIELAGIAGVGETLLLSAEVVARAGDERRELTLVSRATTASGGQVGSSTIAARWGAT